MRRPTASEPPLVVKPVGAGSSHGVRRVDTSQQLGDAVRAALALDDRVLVEELYADARSTSQCSNGRTARAWSALHSRS